jgi:hypothetical protein
MFAGSSGPADAELIDALQASGAQVLRCHDNADGTLCTLVAGHGCPADQDPDVAVVPVIPAGGAPSLGDGVGCAVRSSIPVVVIGHSAPGPYAAVAAGSADGVHDMVAACRAAIDGATEAHTAVAVGALADRCAALGIDPSACRAEVRRTDSGLRLEVGLGDTLDRHAGERVALQVLAAVRRFDPRPGGVSLAVV